MKSSRRQTSSSMSDAGSLMLDGLKTLSEPPTRHPVTRNQHHDASSRGHLWLWFILFILPAPSNVEGCKVEGKVSPRRPDLSLVAPPPGPEDGPGPPACAEPADPANGWTQDKRS
jgi:hypothetical protein